MESTHFKLLETESILTTTCCSQPSRRSGRSSNFGLLMEYIVRNEDASNFVDIM